MVFHLVSLITEPHFLYPDRQACLKFSKRLKRNDVSSPKHLPPHLWQHSAQGTLTPQLIICALTVLSTKNARKLALLNACFAFFKYIIRILLSKEACYIIVFIINALWFVWLCVCNTPKQRSHLFCWQKLICTRIFFYYFLQKLPFWA